MTTNPVFKAFTWLKSFLAERLLVFKQKLSEVCVRHLGQRFLSPPVPAKVQAMKHAEYAWLSLIVYGKSKPARKLDLKLIEQAETVLTDYGWSRLDFFSRSLKIAMHKYHLRVEVWEKKSGTELIIAVCFGGTVFRNLEDWKANFRWFLPFKKDEYTQTMKEIVPAVMKEIDTRCGTGEIKSQTSRLVSVGHSLGGGLAQQFAYSYLSKKGIPKVSAVYAFDPSPVTGFYSVCQATRHQACQGLTIYRLYARGEILAYLRALTSLFVTQSPGNPAITGFRYMLRDHMNPIADHSMVRFAHRLRALSNPNSPQPTQDNPSEVKSPTWK